MVVGLAAAVIGVSILFPGRPPSRRRGPANGATNKDSEREVSVVAMVRLYSDLPSLQHVLYGVEKLLIDDWLKAALDL